MADSDQIYRERAEEHRLTRIEEKVDGINRRLDISNGRLASVEKEVEELQNQSIAGKAQKRLLSFMFAGGLALGGLVATGVFGILNLVSG